MSEENNIKKTIRLLYLEERPLFPGGVATLVVNRDEDKRLIEEISTEGSIFGVSLLLEDNLKSEFEHIERGEGKKAVAMIGTLCRLTRYVRLPNTSLHVFAETLSTFRIAELEDHGINATATVEEITKEKASPREMSAYMRLMKKTLSELVPQSPAFSFGSEATIANIKDPEVLASFVASSITTTKLTLQQLLESPDTKSMYEKLLSFLDSEKALLAMQNKIRSEIVESNRKNDEAYFIKQQISRLEERLGQLTGEKSGGDNVYSRFNVKADEMKELREKIKKKNLPSEYRDAVEKEMVKISMADPAGPEYLISRSYVDTILSLPFPDKDHKPKYSMKNVRKILDRDHFGMKDVKDRIMEFLATRSLSGSDSGAILCLVGPPGTGKTSIAKSIAEALGRKYYRFSVGGMSDESEIKGHRRTYVGALPGKLIHGMIQCGEVDPLILIDEIDKMGSGSYRGDPASAMLEVLDPEQNAKFLDHYLNLTYDLSKVLFIITANTTETIPEPLLDRMEIIEVSGYTPHEKINIAKNYLVPRLKDKNGFKKRNVTFTDEALFSIAEEYSREAGVRNYEQNLDRIFGKLAIKVIEKEQTDDFVVDVSEVEKLLGMPRFDKDDDVKADKSGTALGLAWTKLGGSTLLIEAESLIGHEEFKVTGQLGEVMKESSNIALSTVKKEAALRGMDPAFFRKHSIHLHVPEGAVPKDGPSAGITMTVALWSMIIDKPEKPNLAMTGELTLTGKVMPIGGLKEKVLAAGRNHVKEIIIPEKNKKDLAELDKEVTGDIVFHPVSDISEVLRIAFPDDGTRRLSPSELEEKMRQWEKEGNRNAD